MLYTVLGAVAQFERDVLRERTVAASPPASAAYERLGRCLALTSAQVERRRRCSLVAKVRTKSRVFYASAGPRCIARSHERGATLLLSRDCRDRTQSTTSGEVLRSLRIGNSDVFLNVFEGVSADCLGHRYPSSSCRCNDAVATVSAQ